MCRHILLDKPYDEPKGVTGGSYSPYNRYTSTYQDQATSLYHVGSMYYRATTDPFSPGSSCRDPA